MAGGEGFWDPVPDGAPSLDDLTDVDVSTAPPTGGQALVFDSGSGLWVPGAAGGGGGGGGWDVLINEAGSSLANWTTVAGSWSVDAGGYIKQTGTAASYAMLRYTAKIAPGAGFAMQAEMRVPTGTTSVARAMLGPVGAGAASSTHDPWVGLDDANQVVVQRGDQQVLFSAFTVAKDTWYTVRAEVMGNIATLYVNDTLQVAYEITGPQSGMAVSHYASLVTYRGPLHFRNIKAWRVTSPA